MMFHSTICTFPPRALTLTFQAGERETSSTT